MATLVAIVRIKSIVPREIHAETWEPVLMKRKVTDVSVLQCYLEFTVNVSEVQHVSNIQQPKPFFYDYD